MKVFGPSFRSIENLTFKLFLSYTVKPESLLFDADVPFTCVCGFKNISKSSKSVAGVVFAVVATVGFDNPNISSFNKSFVAATGGTVEGAVLGLLSLNKPKLKISSSVFPALFERPLVAGVLAAVGVVMLVDVGTVSSPNESNSLKIKSEFIYAI